uniref:Uncharacterized protein n=1 Tax=Rhizophora mucronata TaxID=61149 RepID=A0A2P2JZI4_RHIMU
MNQATLRTISYMIQPQIKDILIPAK